MLFKKKKTVTEAPAKLSAEERLAQLVLQIDQSDLKERAQAALKEVVGRQNARIARHEAIKEVKEFAEENPDAAGSILRNWLLDQKAKH